MPPLLGEWAPGSLLSTSGSPHPWLTDLGRVDILCISSQDDHHQSLLLLGLVMPDSWYTDFFDADYLHLWSQMLSNQRTEQEVEGLWQLLELREGSRVLDAPCGFGRISRPLAERGARVLGVDQSRVLLDQAERDRNGLPQEQLGYLYHDLRHPLGEDGFDVALNIFSCLGYGTEEEDVCVLETLRNAVQPGGLVLVETNHRDALAAQLSRQPKPALRLADDTFVLEEARLDPVGGRVQTRWFWSGPKGNGMKTASVRIYTATELTRLMETAGLVLRSTHQGCSLKPFTGDGEEMGGRLALLAERP